MEWFNAAISGDIKFIAQNVAEFKKSVDKYFDNKTALMQAAENDKLEVVKFLIPYESGMRSKKGNAALHYAVINKSTHCIRPLLGFERDIKNESGKTAYDLAVEGHKDDIIAIFDCYDGNDNDAEMEPELEQHEDSLLQELKQQQVELEAQIQQEKTKARELEDQMRYYNNEYLNQYNIDECMIEKYEAECGDGLCEDEEQEKLQFLQNELDMIKLEMGELKALIGQLVGVLKAKNIDRQEEME